MKTYRPIIIVISNRRYLGGDEWGEDMNVVAMPPTRTRQPYALAKLQGYCNADPNDYDDDELRQWGSAYDNLS